MPESRGEGGSHLYGILLMIAGGFIVATGIMNLLGFNPLLEWLPSDLDFLAGTLGWTTIGIGAWSIIGGMGLLRDQEWGWGISLVVLSLVIITFISEVISGFIIQDWFNINMWIKFGAMIAAGVGIVYLLLTKYKYA